MYNRLCQPIGKSAKQLKAGYFSCERLTMSQSRLGNILSRISTNFYSIHRSLELCHLLRCHSKHCLMYGVPKVIKLNSSSSTCFSSWIGSQPGRLTVCWSSPCPMPCNILDVKMENLRLNRCALY
ncbi:ff42a2ed-579b-4efd-9210-54c4326df6cd-CDS [Sclerotinia trifoliorum]|uniref:Ff42a2ed-579b-4efd-9210-54c4326df6cd-CDS n=1 Tax=Sclerotinia trifoliorum TaxID=28548 RepID=A0A8H2VNJ4_9HELO|nr:ff42a2ed-579b-4efd-9210-54c4326df6cd-CDS [Sclerotinia trifoliorum]